MFVSRTGNVVKSLVHSLPAMSLQTSTKWKPSHQTPFRCLSTYSLIRHDSRLITNTDLPTTTTLLSIKEELSNKINGVLSLYREGLSILFPQEDPHSGPICLQGSILLAALLENRAALKNIEIKNASSGSMFRTHTHAFIVCRENGKEVLIDTSYKQFFINRSDLKHRVDALPDVFVGTREELYKLINDFLGPDQRTSFQKALALFGCDESPVSGPQIIQENYRCASQSLELGNRLSNALNLLKEGKHISEIADYCYDALTISPDFSTTGGTPSPSKGILGEKQDLVNFLSWAQNSFAK